MLYAKPAANIDDLPVDRGNLCKRVDRRPQRHRHKRGDGVHAGWARRRVRRDLKFPGHFCHVPVQRACGGHRYRYGELFKRQPARFGRRAGGRPVFRCALGRDCLLLWNSHVGKPCAARGDIGCGTGGRRRTGNRPWPMGQSAFGPCVLGVVWIFVWIPVLQNRLPDLPSQKQRTDGKAICVPAKQVR